MSWNSKQWNLLISVVIASVWWCKACDVASITACIDEASTLLSPLDASGQFDAETFCDNDSNGMISAKLNSCEDMITGIDSCSTEEKENYISQVNYLRVDSGTKVQQYCGDNGEGCADVTAAFAVEVAQCSAPLLELESGSITEITEVCQVLQEGLDCYAAAVGHCDQLEMHLTEAFDELKPYEAFCPGLNYKNKTIPGKIDSAECSVGSVEQSLLTCDQPLYALGEEKDVDKICKGLQEGLDCYAEAVGDCTQKEIDALLQQRLPTMKQQLVYCPDLNYKGDPLLSPKGEIDCDDDDTWMAPYTECTQIMSILGLNDGAIYSTNLTEACRIAQSGIDCLAEKLGHCEESVKYFRQLFEAMRRSSTICGGHDYNGKSIESWLYGLDADKPPSYTCSESAYECVALLFGAGAPHDENGPFFDIKTTGNFHETCRAVRSSMFRRSQDCIDAVIDECDLSSESEPYNERDSIRALSRGLQAMSHMCDCAGDVSGDMSSTTTCLEPILSLTNYDGTLTKEVCSAGQQALSCAKPTLDRCPHMFEYIMRRGDYIQKPGSRGDGATTMPRRDMLGVISECDLKLSKSVQDALKAANSVSTVHTIPGSILLFFTTSLVLLLRN